MMTNAETALKEEDEVLRCVQEMKLELADLRQDRALTPTQSVSELQSQLMKFREDLEAQTNAMMQVQQQMHRIEQLCVRLSDDVNTLAAKL